MTAPSKWHNRYSGNVHVRVQWCALARACEHERAGAYQFAVIAPVDGIGFHRIAVLAGYFNPQPTPIAMRSGVYQPEHHTAITHAAREAIKLALEDETARGSLAPEMIGRLIVVHEHAPAGAGTERGASC